MASRPKRPRAWFSQSKQRQQMWQEAAAGGSSRQGSLASKHACVQKGAPIPVCARACIQKPTTWRNPVKRWNGACLSRLTCHPCYKNRPMHTKTKGQTRTQEVICARLAVTSLDETKKLSLRRLRYTSCMRVRVPGLPIRDCAKGCNNCAQMCAQLSATDVTAKTFFERLYLVLGLLKHRDPFACAALVFKNRLLR